MRIFLAGCYSRMWVLDDYFESKKKQEMRIFLASNNVLPVWGGVTQKMFVTSSDHTYSNPFTTPMRTPNA